MIGESGKEIPFEKHPLYQEAMDQIVAGDKEAAIATLRRLSQRYPDEQFLQDLLVRVQLQSTFGGGEYIPVDHSQGTPILRTVVMVMLAVATCLVIVAAIIALNENFIKDFQRVEAQAERNQELWDSVEWHLDRGDLSGAREILETLAAEFSEDTAVQEALARIDHLKLCSDMLNDAADLGERGDWQAALELLYQMPQDCPNLEKRDKLLADLKEVGTVETAWAEVQRLVDAEDWRAAITTLTWIREQDQEFKTQQVENLLFECHLRVARQLLDGARGDLESVREAAGHIQEALTLRPTDQGLVEEYRLAVGYVAGYEAYERGDWSVAVVRWEPLYAMRPDYQTGVLREKLQESYPLAANQLIAEANGSMMRLTQAIDYFDQALAIDPDNEELQQQRSLAVEYRAGHEAFVQMDFALAISHWGPIYAMRPDYQNGALRENLRSACSQSALPDEQYCIP